jgi:hypothetical protein
LRLFKKISFKTIRIFVNSSRRLMSVDMTSIRSKRFA